MCLYAPQLSLKGPQDLYLIPSVPVSFAGRSKRWQKRFGDSRPPPVFYRKITLLEHEIQQETLGLERIEEQHPKPQNVYNALAVALSGTLLRMRTDKRTLFHLMGKEVLQTIVRYVYPIT